MDPIKVAVIGVGSMGKNHARVYSEIPEANLIAISDADHDIASSVGERMRIPYYTDYREMLVHEKPDAVSIAVPTQIHSEIALAAMESGAHILIEKPIASTVEEGMEIIATASRLKRNLMIGHIVRFNPAIQALKQKLQSGDLGRIFQIICRRVGPFPTRIQDVGVVIDLAPHDLDLMRFLTGSDPIRLYAETQRRLHTEHEDLLLAVLRFSDGITGMLEINWLTPTKVREVVVLGERGMFRVDDLTQDLYFYENSLSQQVSWPALQTIKGVGEGPMTRFAIQRYEPLKAELQSFINSIKNNSPVSVTGEDGLSALRLAQALVNGASTHQVIIL
jgi:UDP-N-acetylglucosamine 3-dehydrogenase